MRPRRLPNSTRPQTRWLPLVVAAACLGGAARGQSLMVGADGAVHLDEFEEASVGKAVVIDQAPDLAPPMMTSDGMAGAAPMYPSTGYSDGASLPMSTEYMPMVAVVSPRPIRHAIFGEFLFLHPTGADIAHAQQQDGTGGAGTTPFGRVGTTDLHYEPGVRVGGDWAMSDSTSLAGTYTYFESNARSRVVPPAIPGGSGAVGSLVHHPGAAILASAGPVDARSVLDFQLADAEYRALLLNDKHFWLNGSAGLRWGRLEQEFGQSGAFTGGNSGVIATQTDIDFDGGGPKFGIDGGRATGKRGFSIYARAGVSPLAGQFRSSYDMTNTTTDLQLVQADWNDDRIVTLLDYEIGLAWTGPQRKWRFATGYTAAYWYNAVRTQDFINAVQNGEYSDVSSTISFDGLTARIERMW